MGRVVGPTGREGEKEGGVFGNPVDPREGGEGWDGGLLEAPGELLFCGGEAARPSCPDWPGIRIRRPQRVQGLLLASHSFPQRGQIMMNPSLRTRNTYSGRDCTIYKYRRSYGNRTRTHWISEKVLPSDNK